MARVAGTGVNGLAGRIERCDNVKDVDLYISKIEEMIARKKELFRDGAFSAGTGVNGSRRRDGANGSSSGNGLSN